MYDRLHPTFSIDFSITYVELMYKNIKNTEFIVGKISEDIFHFVPSWKNWTKLVFFIFSVCVKQVGKQYFVNCYGNGTILKIRHEIYPPLIDSLIAAKDSKIEVICTNMYPCKYPYFYVLLVYDVLNIMGSSYNHRTWALITLLSYQ